MKILDLLNNWRSQRGKALSLYKKGMAKANKQDYVNAITNYSDAFQTSEIPNDLKGMVLYNRALAYSAMNEDEKAAEDLEAMLKISGLPENVKMAASRRRDRIRKRGERRDTPEE